MAFRTARTAAFDVGNGTGLLDGGRGVLEVDGVLDHREGERRRFPGASLRAPEDVAVAERDGHRLHLDRRGLLVFVVPDVHDDVRVEPHVLERLDGRRDGRELAPAGTLGSGLLDGDVDAGTDLRHLLLGEVLHAIGWCPRDEMLNRRFNGGFNGRGGVTYSLIH